MRKQNEKTMPGRVVRDHWNSDPSSMLDFHSDGLSGLRSSGPEYWVNENLEMYCKTCGTNIDPSEVVKGKPLCICMEPQESSEKEIE